MLLLPTSLASSSMAQSLYRLNYSNSDQPCVLVHAANINITLYPDTSVVWFTFCACPFLILLCVQLSGLGVNTSMSMCANNMDKIALVLSDTLGHLLQFLFLKVMDDNSNKSTYWTLQNVIFNNGKY